MTRFRLDGRVAVVTGGASGIGAAITRAFGEQGARVHVADINAPDAAAIERGVSFGVTDVRHLESVREAVAKATLQWGRLDIFVNCAGIGLVGNVQETDSLDWDRLLAVNVTGVFNGCRAAVDQMLAQEPAGGVIINLASVASLIGIARRFAYCATKGAVVAMTRQLALDYVRQGIRCNAICPATVHTPFVDAYIERSHAHEREQILSELNARQPVGRMGRPEEIADLAVYLAADESSFMTGSAVVIDGGWTAQ